MRLQGTPKVGYKELLPELAESVVRKEFLVVVLAHLLPACRLARNMQLDLWVR